MCLAIMQPKGKLTPTENLRRGFTSNPDGAGFAYVDPATGKVKVVKGLMTYKEFIDEFNKHSKHHETSAFIIHFRIGTSGTKDKDNTHPFNIKGGALIHNGVMFSTYGARSDTRVLAETYANRFTYDNVEKNKAAVEKALGYNKFAMIYDDGRTQIINEKEGDWVDGIWYSNTHWNWTRTWQGSSAKGGTTIGAACNIND